MILFINKIIAYRYVRFLLVGFVNTIFGYSIYVFFVFIGFHYVLAILFATILGVVFNFQTIGRLVFKDINFYLFFRFTVLYVVSYFINIILMYYLRSTGFNNYLAGALLIVPMSLLVYFLNKKYVFEK